MNQFKKDILDKTSGGYDVFVKFFGKQCKRRSFLNIYRNDSRNSCSLYRKDDKYCLKDYGNSDWSGDCFHVVAMIQHLDLRTQFMDVMCVIDKECSLGIIPGDYRYTSRRREGLQDAPSRTYSKVKDFRMTPKAFSPQELAYWGRYGISQDTLTRFDVTSLSECRFFREDGTDFVLSWDYRTPLYGYLFRDGDAVCGIKTYRPGASQRFLRAGKFPQPYVFGKGVLPQAGDDLFITGGEKDVMSLAAHGFAAVCYNSETAKVPASDILDFSRRFGRIVFLYDMDDTGRREGGRRLSECSAIGGLSEGKVFHGFLPLPGTKSMKDVSDYFASGKCHNDFLSDLTVTALTEDV